jgi:two-component system, OmpR family, phosphate regulon sensor histidine kinase PhoR
MRAPGQSELATLITQERDGLLSTWRQQVKQLPSARNLDTPTLNDHVPQLLDELADALNSSSDQTIPEALPEVARQFMDWNVFAKAMTSKKW